MQLAYTFLLMLLPALAYSQQQPSALKNAPPPPQLEVQAYILMDYETGTVLASYNAEQSLPPASLTKMMTSYVLSERLQEQTIAPEEMVTISHNAWSKNFPDSSKMFIEVGKKVSIDDLHQGIVVSSGNDASVAIAEHIANSVDGFSEMMNETAERLGMQNSQFKNPHGLDEKGHYSTAYDLAVLSRKLIQNYPNTYALYAQQSFTYNGIKQHNRNALLWKDSNLTRFDGIKTGHVSKIGYNLASSAVLSNNNMRLISVVLGAKNESKRNRETERLMNWGFTYFDTFTPYTAGTVLTQQRTWFSEKDSVDLGIDTPSTLTLPKKDIDKLEANYVLHTTLNAPIQAGTTVGDINFSLDGEPIANFPLVTLEDVSEGSWSKRLRDHIVLFFKKFF